MSKGNMEKKPTRLVRAVTLMLCFLECLLFAGNFSSWSILVFVLKKDHIFASGCKEGNDILNASTFDTGLMVQHTTEWPSTDSVSSNATALQQDSRPGQFQDNEICPGQDSLLVTSFTIAIVVQGVLSIPFGWLLDKHGLRPTRCLGSVLAMAAYILLGTAGPGNLSWLIFPGCICLAISSHIFIMTNCHVCGLAGRHASKVVSLYNGGVNASVSFLVIKLASEAGMSRLHAMLFLTGLVSIVLFTTLFLLPAGHVINVYNQEKESDQAESHLHNEDFSIKETSSFSEQIMKKSSSKEDEGYTNVACDQNIDNHQKAGEDLPKSRITNDSVVLESADPVAKTWSLLKDNLFSPTYLLYLFWFGVLLLRISWFLNTYNYWLTVRVGGDNEKVSYYTNMFGFFKFGGILVAPLAGIYMDYRRQPFTNSGHMRRTMSAVPSLVMTSLTSLLLSISVLLPTESAIFLTLVSAEVNRAFLFATAVALLESVFSPLVYGKMFGVQYTVGALFNFLMYPLTAWTDSTDQGFQQVNTMLLVAVGTTLIFPIQIVGSYLCMKRKQQDDESMKATPDLPSPPVEDVVKSPIDASKDIPLAADPESITISTKHPTSTPHDGAIKHTTKL